jgi:isoamylase
MRHWVESYGIDGFRFDLAPVLGRDPQAFSDKAALFQAIAADPVLSGVKLIAEPWDIGEGGYQLGGFPAPWAEWNDVFRDTVRAFWRGDSGARPALAGALTGSQTVFEPGGRDAHASVNFVCSHDGFTLHDLVSHAERHNEANGEGNRDGHGHNLSANYGIEGPSADPAIMALRARQKRNLLATALLSRGVPMLLMGDELSRSQSGNNNPYCQDNAISWFDWQAGRAHDPALPDFVARLTALRRELPCLREGAFLTGAIDPATGLRDVSWYAPTGREMEPADWHDGSHALAMQLGSGSNPGDRVLVFINGAEAPVTFTAPAQPSDGAWRPVLFTEAADGRPDPSATDLRPGGTFHLGSRSMVLFTHVA